MGKSNKVKLHVVVVVISGCCVAVTWPNELFALAVIQQNMFYCWSSSLSISSVDICESYGVIDLHPANVSLSQCGELRRAGNRTVPPAGCSQPDLSNIDTIEMETISQTAGRRRLVELLQTEWPLIHHPAVAITEIQTQGFVACGTRKQRSLRRIGGEEWLRNE